MLTFYDSNCVDVLVENLGGWMDKDDLRTMEALYGDPKQIRTKEKGFAIITHGNNTAALDCQQAYHGVQLGRHILVT